MRKKGWLYSGFILLVLVIALIPFFAVACGGGEEKSKPVLQYGEYEWRLNEVSFSDDEEYAVNPGHIILQVDFECLSEIGLIQAWLVNEHQISLEVAEAVICYFFDSEGYTYGAESTETLYAAEIFEIIRGIEPPTNVYVIDNQGNEYIAVYMGRQAIHFVVPEDSYGFTLYFLDAEPIELGK